MSSSYSAVVLAGQIADPGLLKEKAGGKSILSHSLDVFDADEMCKEIIVECSPEIHEWVAHDPLTFSIAKMRLAEAKGGQAESCMALVQMAKSSVVVVQDAAFPCFGTDLLSKLLSTAKPDVAAIPGWPVHTALGTITPIEGRETQTEDTSDLFLGSKADYQTGHLTGMTNLSSLYSLQFPQAFSKDSLLKAGAALQAKLGEFNSLCEAYIAGGFEVAVIDGKRDNIGLYTPEDLYLLRKLIGGGTKKKKDKYGGLGW